MKLYGTIKSERSEKGQGGNDYLEIDVTDENRQHVAFFKILPGHKKEVIVQVNDKVVDLKINEKDQACVCDDPLCAKCLLVNCKDPECKVHPESKKKEFREMYRKRN